MRAMRAESFTGYRDLKLVDLPKPVVADGRVLVRITAAGVTPLDHTILSGGYPRATAPLVLGNEGTGVMFTGPYGVFENGTYASGSPCAARICARSRTRSTMRRPAGCP